MWSEIVVQAGQNPGPPLTPAGILSLQDMFCYLKDDYKLHKLKIKKQTNKKTRPLIKIKEKNTSLYFACVLERGVWVKALLRDNGAWESVIFLTSSKIWVSTFLSFTVFFWHGLPCKRTPPPLPVPSGHQRLTSLGCELLIVTSAQLLALGRHSVNVCLMNK